MTKMNYTKNGINYFIFYKYKVPNGTIPNPITIGFREKETNQNVQNLSVHTDSLQSYEAKQTTRSPYGFTSYY